MPMPRRRTFGEAMTPMDGASGMPQGQPTDGMPMMPPMGALPAMPQGPATPMSPAGQGGGMMGMMGAMGMSDGGVARAQAATGSRVYRPNAQGPIQPGNAETFTTPRQEDPSTGYEPGALMEGAEAGGGTPDPALPPQTLLRLLQMLGRV